MIVSYRTNVHISHFIPQNHFRWNYSKRRAGESAGKVGTEQINSNEHHRQEIIKSICPSKQLQSLQKSEETYHSIPSINTPIKALYNPIITHPEERIWAGRTPPAAAPGPGRSEDQARRDETILHGWHEAKNVILSSYQKSANPSRSRRKNLSRNKK